MFQSYCLSRITIRDHNVNCRAGAGVERVRASRSKGLARAAVIAGVGRYLEDVFRPEEGIPDAPIAVANRSSTRRHWLGGLYAGLGYIG